ncbi:right-handed parallel beta-helix repeat-containing protein [Pseudomonas shirazica]|uniref:right-handed parallel beta-helix repeat-containing protein n=1 Tax=Pseudomonas TaxID=286 RepID=UPI003852594A
MKRFKVSGAVAFLIVMVGCLSGESKSVAGENQAGCQLPNDGVLQGNTKLKGGCIYHQSVVISSSNISLDCDGATLDGMGKLKYGIQVVSNGKKLSNVRIENCSVENFAINGIMVGSGIPDFKRSRNRQENYKTSPTQIEIKNVQVDRSGNVGVYLYSYVTNVTLQGSTIKGSKSSGVYLEQSSQSNKIINNIIRDNGGWDGERTGQREGLSIDSSAKNLIQGNSFISNAAGGVFLYKNCGENFSKGMAVLRWQSSNDNIIRDNKFIDEKIGVWVASRQGSDLSHRDCGDPSLDGSKKYYKDYANNNLIEENTFCRNRQYVRIGGDENVVRNNKADVEPSKIVIEPVNMTTKLTGVPPQGNVIENNVYAGCN